MLSANLTPAYAEKIREWQAKRKEQLDSRSRKLKKLEAQQAVGVGVPDDALSAGAYDKRA